MKTFALGLCAALAAVSAAHADPSARAKYQPIMDELARKHDVPERLIHRIIMRESKYAPHLVSKGNYGMMQIKPATARGMGYAGSPAGLLDGKTNLTYAVPYLANAYHIAGRNEDAAVRLYAGGYYYVAKRKGMLAQLQTAHAARGGKGGARSEAQTVALVEDAEPREVAAAPAKVAPAPSAAEPARSAQPVGKTRAARVQPPKAANAEAPQAAAYAAQPEPENPVADLFRAFGEGAGADPAR